VLDQQQLRLLKIGRCHLHDGPEAGGDVVEQATAEAMKFRGRDLPRSDASAGASEGWRPALNATTSAGA
jgi:hypothetical protein